MRLPTIVIAAFACLGLAQSTSYTSIGDTAFKNLRCAASTAYQYSMKNCQASSIRDLCDKVWEQLNTLNINDGSGGTITVRIFRKVSSSEIYLFFPGTSSGSNWSTDFNLTLTSYTFNNFCSGCQIHGGFLKVLNLNKASVAYLTKIVLDQNPGYKLVIAGGSLGGALASLFFAEFRSTWGWGIYPERGITFGQPRTGNVQWAAFMNQVTEANKGVGSSFWRVTHQKDAFVRTPNDPAWLHFGGEIWAEDVGFNRRPTSQSTVFCPQNAYLEPTECVNKGIGSPADHTTYPGYDFQGEMGPCSL